MPLTAIAMSALVGAAHAGSIQFVPKGSAVGSLGGVHTSAILSADASTFTITLVNQSGSGAVTAFYIEAGSALAGLGAGSISNGTGVQFTTLPQGNRDAPQSSASTSAAGVAGVSSVDGFSSIGSPVPGDGSGMYDAMSQWSGTFFGMTRAIDGGVANGQDTGESVSLTFSHDGSFSLDALMAAIAADEIRFVQRYQNFGSEGESGYLGSNIAVVVPLPPAAWAGLATLAGVVGIRRLARRNRG